MPPVSAAKKRKRALINNARLFRHLDRQKSPDKTPDPGFHSNKSDPSSSQQSNELYVKPAVSQKQAAHLISLQKLNSVKRELNTEKKKTTIAQMKYVRQKKKEKTLQSPANSSEMSERSTQHPLHQLEELSKSQKVQKVKNVQKD